MESLALLVTQQLNFESCDVVFWRMLMGQKLLSQQLPREKPLFPFPVAFLFGERLH